MQANLVAEKNDEVAEAPIGDSSEPDVLEDPCDSIQGQCARE